MGFEEALGSETFAQRKRPDCLFASDASASVCRSDVHVERRRTISGDRQRVLVASVGPDQGGRAQSIGVFFPDVVISVALGPNDEPFANLDAERRERIRDEVGAVLRRAGATAIFVTHDQNEALSIAESLK